MIHAVDVQNEAQFALDAERLRLAVATVLEQHEMSGGVTVVITSDEEVAALNRQFRAVDAPTDVLSFPADAPPVDEGDEVPYLGDLVIAYPYAAAQALREQHDLMHSLSLLVIHGTLHLLGYDHDSPAHRAEMWTAQDRVLNALGIPTGIVPALEGEHDANE